MNIPRVLRKQMSEYQRAGFTPVLIEPRGGSHFKVQFEGIDKVFFMTKSASDNHAIHNNLAALRRALKEHGK